MLKPLSDRVILRVKEEEEKTAGGLVLASSAQEKPQVAEVLAVGEGRRTDKGELLPVSVKVGDQVIFEKFAGSEVKVAGESVLIVRESDILAVLA